MTIQFTRLLALVILAGSLCSGTARANSYSTTFSGTENPLSEGGAFLSHLAPTSAIRKTPGFAFDDQNPATQIDAIAVLSWTWTTNQTAQGTFTVISGGSPRELELLTNFTLTPGSPNMITGYECLFVLEGLVYILRWNNPNTSDFTLLVGPTALPGGAVVTGNQGKCTNVSGVITAYIDTGSGFVQVEQVTDSTYTGGAPGFAINIGGAGQAGFSAFSASDSGGGGGATPRNLTLMEVGQ